MICPSVSLRYLVDLIINDYMSLIMVYIVSDYALASGAVAFELIG